MRRTAYAGRDARPYRSASALVPAMLASLLLAGCESARSLSQAAVADDAQPCPAGLERHVRVYASAAPRTVPAELAVNEGAVQRHGLLARRLTIAVTPQESAGRARVLSSTLTLTPFGGTFEGWAQIVSDDGDARRAVEVIPGRLSIAPVLSAAALRAQTLTVDLLLLAGGAPVDGSAVTTGPLWDESGRPTAPDALGVTLTPVRHFTVYDTIEAALELEYIVRRSPFGRQRWKCSSEHRATLVEADAVLPPLWDIGPVTGRARERRLALYEPGAGHIHALFASPAAANAFATWVRQTRAARVGPYQIGLFQRAETAGIQAPAPAGGHIMESFRPLSADELAALGIGRLGEP